jgi:formate dehydrogenase major subunit
MGSNMAEQHPVAFQWVVEAKERGATVLHVDPRYTRTSAIADAHVPLRPGSDVAFLGGVIHQILERGAELREYVQHFTNAPVILKDEFRDTEELDGLFSGWVPEDQVYRVDSWGYAGTSGELAAGKKEQTGDVSGDQAHGAHGMDLPKGEPPEIDLSLEHPRCVFQVLKHHYARYTPEMVERVCGVPPEQLLRVADALIANSGEERTSAFCYAVGWTQHTTGVQMIRAAAIVQLLLGNIGRPGGGILALRGHANIQGSTDIPTLYDILPSYIPMPHSGARDLQGFVDDNAPKTGVWGSLDAYMTSLLKAWFGAAATEDNEFGFKWLPRIDGDHSHYPTMLRMVDGRCEGFLCVGQNPVVGSADGRLMRKALRGLKWLVVRDLTEVETASFWYDSEEVQSGEVRPEDIGTEVFFLPAAAHTEKDGSFTSTERLLQWRRQAVEPPGDCRSDLWFTFHLGRRIRAKLAGSERERDRGIQALTWDYPTHGPLAEPDAEAVLQEINGRHADGTYVAKYEDLKADGSTTCGSWLHAGIYADGVNQTARRRPHGEQSWVAPEWGWAWPANRRILYNRASARPDGTPWSERKRYVWWDAEQGHWTSTGDDPDFPPDKAPDYVPQEDDAKGMDAIRGSTPFIAHPDGLGWLYAPSGLTDGPLPTHYEPHESPVANPLYRVSGSPTRQEFDDPDNPYHRSADDPGAAVFPYVMTTYRLTEHHTAGAMSRTVDYLSELQPEMFVEVSPELAAERGLEHAGWATVVTARAAIEGRVMVTDRMTPLTIGTDPPREIHQVGLPYHWGRAGLSRGDAANELVPVVLDLNTHIAEYKAATCDIRPGRRPRGAALQALLEDYRRRGNVFRRGRHDEGAK